MIQNKKNKSRGIQLSRAGKRIRKGEQDSNVEGGGEEGGREKRRRLFV